MTQPTNPIALFGQLSGAEEDAAQRLKQRESYTAGGRALYFPRTGMVMVPYRMTREGWNCVVVHGNDMYPRGGHDLLVMDYEIETAIELETPKEPAHD